MHPFAFGSAGAADGSGSGGGDVYTGCSEIDGDDSDDLEFALEYAPCHSEINKIIGTAKRRKVYGR